MAIAGAVYAGVSLSSTGASAPRGLRQLLPGSTSAPASAARTAIPLEVTLNPFAADVSNNLSAAPCVVPSTSFPRLERPERALPAAASHGQPVDAVVQRLGRSEPSRIPPPNITFGGLDNASNQTFWGGPFTPPDMDGDIGTTQYFQFLNDLIQIHRKSDGFILKGPCPDTDLWSGFADNYCRTVPFGDPTTNFDRLAQRWVVAEFAFTFDAQPPYHICIAVSQTDDALGKWNRYSYEFKHVPGQAGGDVCPDYPKLGVWPNAYYQSINQFTSCTPAGAFTGGGAIAYDRAKMLAGNLTAQAIWFDNAEPNGGLLPSNMSSGGIPPAPADPNPFVQFVDNSPVSQTLEVWQFAPNFATPASSTFTNTAHLTPAAFDTSVAGVPQPGTAEKLGSLADRLMYRLQYRRFTGVGAHESWVVDHTVDATGNDQAGIRWYELRDLNGGSPSIFQQGTFIGQPADTKHRWMASTAMDAAGNIALGYSVSDGTTTFPSIWYTGRLATDTLGTLPQGEGVIQAGAGSQTSTADRWGDYTTLDVDPIDDCTFWYTNEYYPVTDVSHWYTKIGSFTFTGNCLKTSSVAVASFGSRWNGRQSVTVRWRTRSEVNVLGFNLYRETVKGQVTRVNRSLVPARHAGSASGAAYALVDRSAGRLHAFTYRLQLVTTKGARSWFSAGTAPAPALR